MTMLKGAARSGSGEVTITTEPLGRGGEGSVHSVVKHNIPGVPPASELVAKVYYDPNAGGRREKLTSMIDCPVSDKAVAWPVALLFKSDSSFYGYLMPKLDLKNNREMLYLSNSKERMKVAPDFDVRYAFMAVRNIAAAMIAVHAAGHHIGDVNESNIFIRSDASILFVDSDSMQISGRDGRVFPCHVGKPEYTAPELTHGSLKDIPRTVETDVFAFAVAAYQILMGGATPHQGSFSPDNPNDPLSTVGRIRAGVLPNLVSNEAKKYGFTPRPGVPTDAMPAFLKEHIVAFLSPDPSRRVSDTKNLHTLIQAIDSYVPTLEQCSKETSHWHPIGNSCGWCASKKTSGIDPWGTTIAPVIPKQIGLPSVDFGNQKSASNTTRATRAAPAVAGRQAYYANQAASGGYAHTSSPAAQAYINQYIQQTQTPPAPQKPKKIRGKVTVEYSDGTWGVRPPLGQLFKQSPKMALWAIREEIPGIIKFWWPHDRKAPTLLGLLFGAIASFVTVYLTAWGTSVLLKQNFSELADSASALALLPAASSLFFVLIMLIAGLVARIRRNTRESIPLTTWRFFMVGVFYGAPFVIFILAMVVFNFLKGIAQTQRR